MYNCQPTSNSAVSSIHWDGHSQLLLEACDEDDLANKASQPLDVLEFALPRMDMTTLSDSQTRRHSHLQPDGGAAEVFSLPKSQAQFWSCWPRFMTGSAEHWQPLLPTRPLW